MITNQYIINQLKLVMTKYPSSHHKVFAIRKFLYSLNTNIDLTSLSKSELMRIKNCGDFISECILAARSSYEDVSLSLINEELLPFSHIKDELLELNIKTIDELKSVLRTHHDLVNKISDDKLKLLGLHRASKWLSKIFIITSISKEPALLNNDDSYPVFTLAGSLRRMNKVIKDFDLITTQDYRSVLNYLSTIPNLEVIGNGKKRIRIKLSITDNLGTTDSIEGDVRIIPSESFITGLVYLTGPASFNLKMRSIAKSKGYKLNEYSITTIPTKPYNVDKDEVVIHPKTELELFNLLGMNYLEPKNR